MSIEQALARGPLERPHTSDEFVHGNERRAVLAKGSLLLQEAHIQEALLELAEIIRPDFPDVKINDLSISFGSVRASLMWNRRPAAKGLGVDYEWNCLSINAFPTREEIVIGKEVLAREQWSKKDIVDDAIVIAYKTPHKFLEGPPERL